jgi:hypothetical protein
VDPRRHIRAELRTGGEVIPLRPMHIKRGALAGGTPMVFFDGAKYPLRFDLERLQAALQRLICGRYPFTADAVCEILSWPELNPATMGHLQAAVVGPYFEALIRPRLPRSA